jgi:cellulose synthase (UDP-forming)
MFDNWQWMFAYPTIILTLIVPIWIVSRLRPGFGRRTAIVTTLTVGTVYLTWRVLFTIPTDNRWNTIIGVILLAVEIIGFAQFVIFYILQWRPFSARHVPLSVFGQLPSIDVFIATYNEPVSTLRMTIAGAMAMRYPTEAVRVYVCDDGGRDQVRQLAEQYGAIHLTREDHAHAKAGNLNHALDVSDGDLIVTLDADMVPRPEFLERTVGLFDDREMGFVQSPQAFYNEDSFQYNLFSGQALPNEQDFFMRTLQAGRARFNATIYVGSNAVFRRSALEKIGGFAIGVITEDLATGMLIQAAKYRTEFVPEVLAAGLSPESFADMLKQRDRWCRGNVQVTRKWNPLTLPGLTPMQRWLYWDGFVYWYFGVFKIVYLLTPLLFLLFGVFALKASLEGLAVFWLPSIVCSRLCFRIVVGRRRSFAWSHIYESALTPSIAFSAIAETVGLRVDAFNVTPKGIGSQRRIFHWRIALPHLGLLAMWVAGLIKVFVFSPQLIGHSALYINISWSLYNVVGLVAAVAVCVDRPRLRSAERIGVHSAVTVAFQDIGMHPGELIDLSLTGARLAVPYSDSLNSDDLVMLNPSITAVRIPGVGEVTGEMRWVDSTADEVTAGFWFDPLTPEQTMDLVRLITQSPAWVRGDEEHKAQLGVAGWRAAQGAARPATPWRRSQVRMFSGATATLRPLTASEGRPALERAWGRDGELVQVGGWPGGSSGVARQVDDWHGSAHVGPDSEGFKAVVEDIGFGGFLLTLRHRLEPGTFVSVEIPQNLPRREVAEVRWCNRRGRQYEAGLRFDRAHYAEPGYEFRAEAQAQAQR